MKNVMKKGVCVLVASLLACSAFADTQQAAASADQQQAAAASTAPVANAHAKKSKHGKKATKSAKEEASQQG